MNDEVKFHPEKIQNTYRHWMENIRDWNISRQLWWGNKFQRIITEKEVRIM